MRLYFYLKPVARAQLARGLNTMPARIIAALQAAGWEVTLCPEAERPDIPHREDYHMVLNCPTEGDRCLTLRQAGFDPFWQLETTNTRWHWQVAKRAYVQPEVPQDRIDGFLQTWRRHVLKDARPQGGGGILVPLQGRLTEHRGFQAASPLVMLQQTLTRWPDRPVTATLHPSERHDADETEGLAKLQRRYPRLAVQMGSEPLLAACDLVVTQNSTVAFKGFLLDKPAMLWAQIDWHHVAASVPRDGLEAAFAAAGTPQDFGRYLFWYLRRQALCAWEDNPKAIRNRLRALGWPVREPK